MILESLRILTQWIMTACSIVITFHCISIEDSSSRAVFSYSLKAAKPHLSLRHRSGTCCPSYYHHHYRVEYGRSDRSNELLSIVAATASSGDDLEETATEQYDYEEAPEEVDPNAGRRKNALSDLAAAIYDKVFFYGLETPQVQHKGGDSRNPAVTKRGFRDFKRRAKRSLKNSNPFFTESEQLALYIGEAYEKEDRLNDRETDASYSSNTGSSSGSSVSSSNSNSGSSGGGRVGGSAYYKGERKNSNLPYDPTDYRSLATYAFRLNKFIKKQQKQLKILDVSIAATDAESNEELQELRLQQQDIAFKVQQAKVELITVQALAEELEL